MQVAIAHAVDAELAATDGLDQLAVIRREWLERTHPPTMPVRGLGVDDAPIVVASKKLAGTARIGSS